MSLRVALSTPDGKSRYVQRLFATIADRYDLITVLLSFGCDRRWKARLVDMAAPAVGCAALDLACGTGDIAAELVRRGARVVGLDITPRMIALAGARVRGRPASPRFLVGDMMALPFPDGAFDLVTTGYGIRNAPVMEPALREIHRVLRPGGRLLSLDFNRPERPVVRAIYFGYLRIVGGALGFALHRDPDTYRYIPESLRQYPGATGVAEMMRGVGFRHAGFVGVLGGLMAINYGSR